MVWHFGWSFDCTFCYHDTAQHKTHPASFIEVAKRLKIAAMDCWAMGDDPQDVIAARAAGIYAVAALCGAVDKEALESAKTE